MARASYRRKAGATSEEGRFEASRIQAARRRGYTNREIASAFGINERTVRKIVSGETSGKRIYREKIAPTRNVAPEARNLSIVRLDLVIGTDDAGNPVVRTVNAKTPLIAGRTPTPFDVFLLPDLGAVAQAEMQRLQNRYAGTQDVAHPASRVSISSVRPIVKRDPRKRLVTIRGTYA